MLTQAELKKKALRPWTTGASLTSWLAEQSLFPLDITFSKPTGRVLSNDYLKVRDWILELHNNSKAIKGSGYTLEYRAINHMQLGRQNIPDRIVFETREDWLSFIAKEKAFKDFEKLTAETRRKLPQVMAFILDKPMRVLEYPAVWSELITVCRYFQVNPRPNRYIRQLDIQGIDSKFIENHRGILSEMLNLALDSEDFDKTVTGVTENGFERRFGLRYDEPMIRFRLLDVQDSADGQLAVTDMSVPLSQFAEPGVSTVYITENKVNGLAFPAVKDSMVVFGLGYGIRSLDSVTWLDNKRIVYWGDIDTHGFSILSRLRERFKHTQSLLMDQTTLEQHLLLCVKEPEKKRFLGSLSNLTEDEQSLFEALKNNALGENLRLEQERVRYSLLQQALYETEG